MISQQVEWAGRTPCYPGLGVSASSSRFGVDRALKYSFELTKKRHAKNVWKGLTVGAFAGAAVGIAVDALDRLGEGSHHAAEKAKARGAELADQLKDHVPDVIDATKERADDVMRSVRDTI